MRAVRLSDTAMLHRLSRMVFMNGQPDGCRDYRTENFLPFTTKSSIGRYDDHDNEDGPFHFVVVSVNQAALAEIYSIPRTAAETLVHTPRLVCGRRW